MRFTLVCLALAAPVAADTTGADLFMQFCATCHGVAADGDGPMAPILLAPPADLTGLAEAAGGTFPVAEVVSRVDGRDPLLAHGGEMPLWGEVFAGHAVVAVAAADGQPVLAAEPIVRIVEYLATLQR